MFFNLLLHGNDTLLYSMENAMKYNGQFFILRITKTKEQTFRFDPRTREFKLILSFSKKQEGNAVNLYL